MKSTLIRKLRICANVLIMIGLAIVAINITGFFVFTTIDGNEPGAPPADIQISEEEFWAKAYKKKGEPIRDYVKRLTGLIDKRMIAIDPTYAKPTFFENWILWSRARRIGYHEWLDSEKAIRLGGGYCSQHAIVMDNILDEQGIESRILGLNGHVLNEVLIDGEWYVADPNYNVTFDASLAELEDNPFKVYQAYREAGLPEQTARHWQDVFGTAADNWHFRSSLAYGSMVYFLQEKASLLLIWLVPAALIGIGLLIMLVIRIRKPFAA